MRKKACQSQKMTHAITKNKAQIYAVFVIIKKITGFFCSCFKNDHSIRMSFVHLQGKKICVPSYSNH